MGDWLFVKRNKNTGQYKTDEEGGGTVTDVEVNGQSVVNEQGVAEIAIPSPPTIPVEDVEVNGESVVNAQKIAQIKSYKEVTQAEYEALPASKLSDDILYAIKDGGQAVDGFPPLIYSDEEREIGVWRDGKPLYQKTIPVAFGTSNTEYEIESNIDKFMFVPEATFKIQNSSYNVTNYGFYVSASDRVQVYYRPSNHKLVVMSVSSDIAGNGFITYRYTKTTDTPGSGTWTTQGAIAHHYSTDEHIIGTWIDGKPLYEKVCEISSGITGGSFTYAHNIDNLKEVVKADCNYFYSGASCPAYIYPVNNTSSANSYINGEYTVAYNGCTSTIIALTIGTAIASSLDKIITILCYTKTTD